MKIAELYAKSFVGAAAQVLETLGATEVACLAIETKQSEEHAVIATTLGLLTCRTIPRVGSEPLEVDGVHGSLTRWQDAPIPKGVGVELDRRPNGEEWTPAQWVFDVKLEGVNADTLTDAAFGDFARAYLRLSGWGPAAVTEEGPGGDGGEHPGRGSRDVQSSRLDVSGVAGRRGR